MADIRKTVRFYDTVLIDENNETGAVEDGFWMELIDAIASWTADERVYPVSGVEYFGEGFRPSRPALPHIQVGRVRDLSEQLNRYNRASGSVAPLTFDDPDDRVAEPTFIVPFGSHNRVAIMSPAVRATRHETLARWVTGVCELVVQGKSVELRPVVDASVLEQLSGSNGAVMLEVHVNPGAEVPDGGGAVGEAFRDAQKQDLEEAGLTLRWSLGRAGGSSSARDALKNGALWVANGGFSHRAEVKIVREGEDGTLHRELHSLFDDRITQQVEFFVPEGQRPSDEVILTSIGEAIQRFVRSDVSAVAPTV